MAVSWIRQAPNARTWLTEAAWGLPGSKGRVALLLRGATRRLRRAIVFARRPSLTFRRHFDDCGSVILYLANRIDEGNAADLFHIDGGTRIVKLFRRPPSGNERIPRLMLDAETMAYDIVVAHDNLRSHAPAYYGRAVVESVVGPDGRPLADAYATATPRYLLDCGYVTERLRGPDKKITRMYRRFPHLMKLMVQFEQSGIWINDADVFGWEHYETAKLIDFATWDVGAGPN